MALRVVKKVIPVTVWTGCYEQKWKGRIVPDSFTHPAKMARGLVVRIYNHLLENELLHTGDTVLDPFVGIGTTVIEGANRSIRVIGVELESKFVGLARDNVGKYQRFWASMGYPLPVIMQGDSRKLRQVLGAVGAEVVISSPPFLDARSNTTRSVVVKHGGPAEERHHVMPGASGYGDTPGNLETFPVGDIEAVISSPPYAEIATGAGGLNTKPPQHEGQQAGRSASSASQDTDQRYGETEGQLARMEKGEVDAVIGGPPYAEEGLGHGHRGPTSKMGQGIFDGRKAAIGYEHYGRTPGQLGRLSSKKSDDHGETFWSAAQQVVRETYAVLKPGGVAVWITKAFVRDKKLVDFPGDWRKLCESVGFVTQEEIRAVFTAERTVKGQKVKLERKSFFRRLAEKKGAPPIDWETVWIMQKPYTQQRGILTWR
jgi:DNA modification methylase